LSAAGVVAALSVEARTLGKLVRRSDGLYAVKGGPWVGVCGVGRPAAAAAARRLIEAGANPLVSWGMAGGLDPELPAGTICLPRSVLCDGASHTTDHHWRELLTAAIASRGGVAFGSILTSDVAIGDVAGKAAAFARTGAVAVDMESAAVAEVAAAHRVPFIAIRAIVDTAGDAIPQAAVAATQAGTVRILRLIKGLILSPADLAPLLQLAGRYRAARCALVDVARTGALAPVAFATSAPNRIA
jgi:adenosylhomocysteine nucleosidase